MGRWLLALLLTAMMWLPSVALASPAEEGPAVGGDEVTPDAGVVGVEAGAAVPSTRAPPFQACQTMLTEMSSGEGVKAVREVREPLGALPAPANEPYLSTQLDGNVRLWPSQNRAKRLDTMGRTAETTAFERGEPE